MILIDKLAICCDLVYLRSKHIFRISILFLFFVLFILPITSVFADEKRATHRVINDLSVPFDINIQATHLTGTHNLRTIIAKLKKVKYEKDQFETESEYDERTRSINLIGSVNTDSLLAFKFSSRSLPLCGTAYSADLKVLSVDCEFASKDDFFLPKENQIIKSFTIGVVTSVDKRGYVGTNAFGVKKNITKRNATGNGLAIINLYDITTGEHENFLRKLSLNLPNVTPEMARRNIGDIGLLFVVKLINPFLLQNSIFKSPTLDQPIEFKGEYEFLRVNLRQIWVIDLKHGDVLSRFDERGNVLE